jgi:hypothetical protein
MLVVTVKLRSLILAGMAVAIWLGVMHDQFGWWL